MSNTKDTPMDKEEPNWVTKYNNSPVNKKRQNVVESVSEHFNGGSGDTATLYDIAKFVEPLLKENESLKLELQSIKDSDTPIYTHWEMMKRVAEHTRDLNSELQKQKELKNELVNALKVITKERSFRGGFPHTTNVFESLIKKSSEI